MPSTPSPNLLSSLPTYAQAIARLTPLAPVLGAERVALGAAAGRILRETVAADRDQPPFHRSAMDGFAVRSAGFDAARDWEVAGSASAGAAVTYFGRASTGQPGPGQVIRIATGAPVPAPFDAVIPIELATVASAADGSETVRFATPQAPPGANIHKQASDAAAGDVVLTVGQRLTPQAIALAASMGVTQLTVAASPRITVLTSGDEVVAPDTPSSDLAPHQIRNSNGPMLLALLRAMGVADDCLNHVHLPDEPEATLAAARESLAWSHLVVTVGGASVGDRDFVKHAWRRLGLGYVLQGARLQPGKPVYAAAPGLSDDESAAATPPSPTAAPDASDNKLVLGLPGNPVSVLATAHLFLWPLIRQMTGQVNDVQITPPGDAPDSADARRPELAGLFNTSLPWRWTPIANAIKPKPQRQLFRMAARDASAAARLLTWQGSGDLAHTAAAQGILAHPLTDEPCAAGAMLPYLPLIDSAG